MLDERKWQILEAIIREYILTAEPVGSRTLTRRYELGISAATIRNEMADLEDLGFLEQPHASAGRIPSDKGYRTFVDSLVKEKDLPTISEEVRTAFLSKKNQIHELIQETTRILSQSTHYISMGVAPDPQKTVFQHLQLVPLAERKVIAIMVTDTGLVQNQILTTPVSMDRKELSQISDFFNDRLQGVKLKEIDEAMMKKLEIDLVNRYDIMSEVVRALYLDLLGDVNRKLQQVFLEGTTYMMEQPEFNDVHKLKEVLSLVEQRELLCNILQKNSDTDIQVTIGQENAVKEMQNCSIVSATYSVKGQSLGRIGILGPTRMEYGKVISLLQFVAGVLTKNLSEEEK